MITALIKEYNKFKLDINVNYLLNEIREKYKELVKGGKHEKFS